MGVQQFVCFPGVQEIVFFPLRPHSSCPLQPDFYITPSLGAFLKW